MMKHTRRKGGGVAAFDGVLSYVLTYSLKRVAQIYCRQ